MRKADHYRSIRRAKRDKNRITNAKRCEDFIAKINAYRVHHKVQSRFITNEEIARRLNLNIDTCKALGVFEKMIKRLPKREERVRRVPLPLIEYPAGHVSHDPFLQSVVPMLLMGGVLSRMSRR